MKQLLVATLPAPVVLYFGCWLLFTGNLPFAAVVVVLMLLAVAAFAIWDALKFVVATWF